MKALSAEPEGSTVAWIVEDVPVAATRRVLVVDDDARFRSAVARFLGRNGWECSEVSSGKEACKRARAEQFDIAIVDCWMPEMSGFETIHELATADPCLPVVMISAMGTASTRREALKQGAVDFVDKDAPPAVMESVVGRQMSQTETRRLMFDAQEHPVGRIARGVILLVDDHEGFRRAMARTLKKAGFRVVEAATGSTAIGLGERGGIDAAIIDLHLPDTNGIEVARILRALKSSVAVALVSGEANQQEKSRAIACGIMGCMNKTESLDRLAKVAECLVKQTHRARAEEARALRPPDSWLTRTRKAWARSLKHGRRNLQQREARVVVAGLVVAALIALSAMDVMTRYEMAQVGMGNQQARPSMSLIDMYDRISGYLERDEQRETNSGQTAVNEVR